jgi:hypothetical protein
MRQLSGGWNSATRPLLIGREDMNRTMRATSQDEHGGPEVLKCLGDPRLVSPRARNHVNVLLAALTALESAEPSPAGLGCRHGHADRPAPRPRSAGPMQKVEGSNPFNRFPERST